MKAYGSKRTYGGCRTRRPVPGGRIIVQVFVKNRKRVRALVKRALQFN